MKVEIHRRELDLETAKTILKPGDVLEITEGYWRVRIPELGFPPNSSFEEIETVILNKNFKYLRFATGYILPKECTQLTFLHCFDLEPGLLYPLNDAIFLFQVCDPSGGRFFGKVVFLPLWYCGFSHSVRLNGKPFFRAKCKNDHPGFVIQLPLEFDGDDDIENPLFLQRKITVRL